MPPKGNQGTKKASKNTERNKKNNSSKKNVKANVAKIKCSVPIAVGAVMAQRTLQPTICCPPYGCEVKCCLHGPGYRQC